MEPATTTEPIAPATKVSTKPIPRFPRVAGDAVDAPFCFDRDSVPRNNKPAKRVAVDAPARRVTVDAPFCFDRDSVPRAVGIIHFFLMACPKSLHHFGTPAGRVTFACWFALTVATVKKQSNELSPALCGP